MDIDIAVLRQLEREREIPLETIVQAIEHYFGRRPDGPAPFAP